MRASLLHPTHAVLDTVGQLRNIEVVAMVDIPLPGPKVDREALAVENTPNCISIGKLRTDENFCFGWNFECPQCKYRDPGCTLQGPGGSSESVQMIVDNNVPLLPQDESLAPGTIAAAAVISQLRALPDSRVNDLVDWFYDIIDDYWNAYKIKEPIPSKEEVYHAVFAMAARKRMRAKGPATESEVIR